MKMAGYLCSELNTSKSAERIGAKIAASRPCKSFHKKSCNVDWLRKRYKTD